MNTIIQDFTQRINLRLSTHMMLAICGPLLILLAYFIGRHSALLNKDKLESSFTITKTEVVTEAANNPISVGKIYASSKGKKYYIEGLCDSNVSVKNKIYYKDEATAVASGKQKAAGCK